MEHKITDAELDAKEQAQFEKEYEQWCTETELARFGYVVVDNSKIRKTVNQKN